MRTLPDSTWRWKYLEARGRRPIYYVVIEKSEGITDPDGGTSVWPGSGDGLDTRVYTTGTVTWSDRATLLSSLVLDEGRMNRESVGDVIFQVAADREPGGVADGGDFTFWLDNTDGFEGALEAAGISFGGRKCTLGITFAGVTNRANDIQLFTGEITDVQPGGEKLTFRVESIDRRKDTELPPSDYTPEVADFAFGKDGRPIPLVFGDHDMAPGLMIKHISDSGSTDTGPVLKFVDTATLAIGGITRFRWADSGLNEAGGLASIVTGTRPNMTQYTTYINNDADGQIAFYDPDISKLECEIICKPTGFANYPGVGYTIPGNAASVIEDAGLDPVEIAAGLGTATVLVFKIPVITTSANIHVNTTTRNTGVFLQPDLVLALDADGYFYASIADEKDSWGSWTVCMNVSAFDQSDNGAVDLIGYAPQAAWQFVGGASIDWTKFNTLSELTARFLKLFVTDTSGSGSAVDVYRLRIAIGFTVDFPADGYYAVMEGYVDDASGTVTGVAATLLENPAHVVAALWRFWGAEPNVDITEHRVVAGLYRSGWKLASVIDERSDLSRIVDDVCRESLLWSWSDEAGKSRLFAMDAPSAPDFYLTPDLVSEGRLDAAELSPLDEVITDFTVKYAYNPARNEFDGVVSCNASASSTELGAAWESLCAWAEFNNGGRSKSETFELPWYRDRDTAVEITKKLVAWHGSRRRILEWTSDLAMLQMQLGDSFRLAPDWSRPDWPASMKAATYRITMKRHMPKSDTIKFRAVQVF